MACRLFAGFCAVAAGLFTSSYPPASSSELAVIQEQVATTGVTDREKTPTDLEQLAERLVTQCAGVQRGEHVLVAGGSHDQELLENIAVHVRKAGAFPLLTLSSDRLTKRLFFDVPAELDTQADTLGLQLANHLNAAILLANGLEEAPFAEADPKRMADRAKGDQPVADAMLKHGVRQVEVGNGLYPTEWRAQRFGMSYDDLKKMFWESVNVDYTSLAARAEEVKGVLAQGTELHITDANGTDLKVRIQGRPIYSSDGMVSPEELKKGGPVASSFLPAGEVYIVPVPGTAGGKIVRPQEYFEGKEIQNLTLTFADGKLVSLTGVGPGFDRMKATYEAAAEGKDVFAVVDFGINPNIKLPARSTVATWVPAGTVTMGIGNNVWAGGENKAPYAYYVSIPGTTVRLDGKTVVENGALKM